MLKAIRVRRLKFGCCLGQDVSKVNIMSKVLIVAKLNLGVMSKKKGVLQPKM